MRVRGKTVTAPPPINCDIYRGPEKITFVCNAVLDYKNFDDLVPVPKPPLITKRGGATSRDTSDANFLEKVHRYATLRTAYLVITSISSTPDLEWDTVKLDDPETWLKYEDELRSFLSEPEMERLTKAVMEANSPTETRQSEALDRFTPSQEEAESSQSQVGELPTTPSGEPAKDSE